MLATLISPETDESLRSAETDLENKRRILARDTALLRKQYISVEEEQDAETSVRMAEASVRSLKQQQQYKNIVAPFSGTVTERFADPGALVQNATTSQVAALPLFTIAKLDELRIYIYVEQQNASLVRPGYPVTITLPEKSAKMLTAKVTRQAGDLDPQTRTELVEIDYDNRHQDIVAGSFVNVHLKGPAASNMRISSDALIIKGEKYFAAVIARDSTLHFRPIDIGENTGVYVVVYSGLDTSDKVALNVRSDLQDGAKVRPVKQKQ
jgi:membrane fusion protein, multidrug efflux system